MKGKGVIYLLDLNYTLVANSPARGSPPTRPFIRQMEQEEYRQWLVELLRPHRVILMTARPDSYREVTLARIFACTGWQPMDAYFAYVRSRPHLIKERILKDCIFPKYGYTDYFALESNPHTRAMYRRYGIPSVRVGDQEMS